MFQGWVGDTSAVDACMRMAQAPRLLCKGGRRPALMLPITVQQQPLPLTPLQADPPSPLMSTVPLMRFTSAKRSSLCRVCHGFVGGSGLDLR